jgi:hypothetical protein
MDTLRVPKRRFHKHIERMGIDSWFTGPPHSFNGRDVRGDSQALFNRLVMSLSDSELEAKRDQFVESYSHYMTEVEKALENEYMYDRMIEKSKESSNDVNFRWQQRKWEKKRKWAISEMDRLGPVICLMTTHILSVRAGIANPTKEIIVPETPPLD